MQKILKFFWQLVKWCIPLHIRKGIHAWITFGEGEIELVYGIVRDHPDVDTMVDVGAHFGTTLLPFAKSGVNIYAFEPDPKNREVLERNTAGLSNVFIDARALSNESKKNVPFFSSEVSTGISGLSSFDSSHHQTASVDLVTFREFCIEKDLNKVDVIKVDTEGYDYFVLQGVPWERLQPSFILVEFEDHKTIPLGYTMHDLASYLQNKGYHLLVSEWYPVKKYGGPHKWRKFWEYPGEPEGGKDSHGNIFAVKNESDFEHLKANAKSWYFRNKFRNLFYGL